MKPIVWVVLAMLTAAIWWFVQHWLDSRLAVPPVTPVPVSFPGGPVAAIARDPITGKPLATESHPVY
jgi:hypothetical protein